MVILWLVIAIGFMHISPAAFWPAALISLTLPGALVLNLLFLVIWLFRRSFKAFLPLLVVVLCWGYHTRGIALNLGYGNESLEVSPQTLHVLSYNVRIFNTYAHLQDKDQTSSKKMIRYVADHPSDVYCLQEFYNDKTSPVFNAVSKIGRQKQKDFFVSEALINGIGAQFGLAIFSKYPIIKKGSIFFQKQTNNHGMFADIKFNQDTIRIYNFHFQSMSIDEQDIVNTYKDQENLKSEGLKLMRLFKKGVVKRAVQVDSLLAHVGRCRYPVILCGDINDLPYSYTYERLSKNYTNAFQAKGVGIGATYNGKLPFVRIDNQFSSKDLKVLTFGLHDSIPYSDHFPTTATYKISRGDK